MQEGATPLFMTSQNGHKEVAQLLLQNEAQPDIQCKVCIILFCDTIIVKFIITSAVFNAKHRTLIVFINLTGLYHPSHDG